MGYKPPRRDKVTLDLEVYRNYFLFMVKDFKTRRVIFSEQHNIKEGSGLDIDRIKHLLRKYTVVTFNGNGYDIPMLALALQGANCRKLKEASDHIIQHRLKPWDFRDIYDAEIPGYVDTIDLMEVAPGDGGLKLYGGRVHSRWMQDLPIEPDELITASVIPLMRRYCSNDNEVTIDLYEAMVEKIDLRYEMSEEYGIDLRSKSDAQIAEAVIIGTLAKMRGCRPYDIKKPRVPAGTRYRYNIPSFISFQTPEMQEILELVRDAWYVVKDDGSFDIPPELDKMIPLGFGTYKLGNGGLHSSEKRQAIVRQPDEILVDRDVASYYPMIILILKLFPKHLGEAFLEVYNGIVQGRLKAKGTTKKYKKAYAASNDPEDKRQADHWGIITESLKIVINGSFGKLGSKYSKLYSPDLMIQVTLTGQLALLMLIESLHLDGINVVSANTDGIIIHTKKRNQAKLDHHIQAWEKKTGFETEDTPYTAVYSRDVNSYMAVKEDGTVKAKGGFSDPHEDLRVKLSTNPTNMICVTAVKAYLSKGTPLEETIRACTDVREFISVRRVNGGGLLADEALPKKTTQKEMTEWLLAAGWDKVGRRTFDHWDHSEMDIIDAYDIVRSQVGTEYLGKVVRWYYGKGSKKCIVYKTNGNTVSKSNGCVPLMTLPDELPADIDYDWYIEEAKGMLESMGAFDAEYEL